MFFLNEATSQQEKKHGRTKKKSIEVQVEWMVGRLYTFDC